MGIFSSLNREQKESIGLLSTGTFLEYFDLMLYVHMAVLLNELFFSPRDPHSASILAATAFCSSLALRPIGALFFGWIGDHVGRKSTIIITTLIMAVSCVVMANLPTYAQIGVSAAWIVTICRILQGMSSMGELVGAQIYLTETVGRSASYPVVASLSIFIGLGKMAALGLATLVISFGFNWRIAFWIGAAIAIVSAAARTRLRETPVFLEMQRKWLKKQVHEMNLETDALLGIDEGAKTNATWKEPVKGKTLVSYFLIQCGFPLCVYMVFFYFNPILKESFGYSSEDIIKHNFLLSGIATVCWIVYTYLSCHIHPIKIIKVAGISALFLMISLPFLLINVASLVQLFLIQALFLVFPLSAMPAEAVLISHLPFYRRATYATFLFALTRALVYIATSFGLIYLTGYFGHFGIWVLSLPISVFFLYGVFHFEGLERKRKIVT